MGEKISALPAAGTLIGDELVAVVQDGETRKTDTLALAAIGGGIAASTAGDVTATLTPVALADLERTVQAGQTVSFNFVLPFVEDVDADGFGFDLEGGTIGGAQVTDIRHHWYLIDETGVAGQGLQDSLGGASVAPVDTTGFGGCLYCNGTVTVNTTGTIAPRVYQHSHSTGTITVFRGAFVRFG